MSVTTKCCAPLGTCDETEKVVRKLTKRQLKGTLGDNYDKTNTMVFPISRWLTKQGEGGTLESYHAAKMAPTPLR